MVHFDDLWSNSVTRQDNFNWTKLMKRTKLKNSNVTFRFARSAFGLLRSALDKEIDQIRIQFCLIKNGYCGKAMLRQRKKESRFKA